VRRHVSSGSPYEPIWGYVRALVDGRHVYVSGTAPIMPDGGEPPPDAYGQTKRCLEIITEALAGAGAAPEHVVRTRIYLTSVDVWEEVARAHAEVFGAARPTSTAVVTQLIDPRWHVEIEADALLP
jgi:enamine deaminase RidA (YjgF/YER057c/UK114 family)